MTNILSDYQKEVFMDVYKTSLGALLSSNQFLDNISVKIAMSSIELLTDEDNLRKPSDIINALNERRSDEPLEFPVIEE